MVNARFSKQVHPGEGDARSDEVTPDWGSGSGRDPGVSIGATFPNAARRSAIHPATCFGESREGVTIRDPVDHSPMRAPPFHMPRAFHLSCAAVATACGAVVLARLGAPTSYIVVNVAALFVGAAFGAGLSVLGSRVKAGQGLIVALLGASLIATALFGVEFEGAVRWVSIGGFALQPAFLAVPLLLLCCARRQDAWSIAGVALAALGLALQPDRALAAALLAGLIVLAARRPALPGLGAATIAGAAFAATMLRPDVVPPSRFVEGVIDLAFADGAWIGLVAVTGLALLVAPFFVGVLFGASASAQLRLELSMLGAFWAAVIVAALVGDYPTPFVGYGASAIVGYGVSAWLAWDGDRKGGA